MTILTHTENMIKTKLGAVSWKVITHPPYSPDLAPIDCHLFGK
jgi:hypothetical protein